MSIHLFFLKLSPNVFIKQQCSLFMNLLYSSGYTCFFISMDFFKSSLDHAYWTSESDRFCNITLVRMYVCMYVCNELISETAPTIFLKLGMKLGDNKGKKIARPDFL